MEWIIIDDGSDKIEDLIKSYNIPQIKYIKLPSKISLGQKRNMMHNHATGSIIVYMDDDDYYPPERVSHAVETLQANPKAMIAGSSEMYVYFKHINKMYQSGPFNQNHATAATFAFRVELLKDTKYEDHAALAEEKVFLKNYTVPMAQLDPLKTILVFSHNQNTFDKRSLLEMGQNPTFKESNKTVPMFIRTKDEKPIMEFFLKDIDEKLKHYEPGEPKNKPDVLKQLKEIEETRALQMNESGQIPQQKIMLQRPGEVPVELTIEDVLKILHNQQDHIKTLLEILFPEISCTIQYI
jgi:glycosyltransferase involved in cell wall biosynthesis